MGFKPLKYPSWYCVSACDESFIPTRLKIRGSIYYLMYRSVCLLIFFCRLRSNKFVWSKYPYHIKVMGCPSVSVCHLISCKPLLLLFALFREASYKYWEELYKLFHVHSYLKRNRMSVCVYWRISLTAEPIWFSFTI